MDPGQTGWWFVYGRFNAISGFIKKCHNIKRISLLYRGVFMTILRKNKACLFRG